MKKLYTLLLLLAFFCSAYAQSVRDFAGTVTDAKSSPVQGATVSLLNTNYKAITDAKGAFAFKNVPPGSYTLYVSHVAYAAAHQDITINGHSAPVIISLVEINKRLDEVVVTANKTEEEIQKVPLSISALSAKQVRDARIWNLKDITAIVPNLYSASPGDNRGVRRPAERSIRYGTRIGRSRGLLPFCSHCAW